jgi:hypothetical protein
VGRVQGANPLGDRNTTVYDAASQPVVALDAENRRTTSVYDGFLTTASTASH